MTSPVVDFIFPVVHDCAQPDHSTLSPPCTESCCSERSAHSDPHPADTSSTHIGCISVGLVMLGVALVVACSCDQNVTSNLWSVCVPGRCSHHTSLFAVDTSRQQEVPVAFVRLRTRLGQDQRVLSITQQRYITARRWMGHGSQLDRSSLTRQISLGTRTQHR
jgi:hypothetical protein